MSCNVCLMDADLFLATHCQHSCCRDCMVDFLRVSFIDDPRPVVQCFDCKTAISSDDAMRLLLVAGESGLAAKLGDRCLSRLMAGNEDFQYCPSCSAPISGCSTTQFWDCCCGFTFCVTCRKSEAKHGKNAKCSEPFNLRKTEAERNEQLFNKWQEEEAQNSDPLRPCPKCGLGITKNEGCHHVTCRCGAEFCYICLANYYDPETGECHFQKDGIRCASMSWLQFQQDTEYQQFLGIISKEDAAAATEKRAMQNRPSVRARRFLQENATMVALTCPLWVGLSPAIAVAVAGYVAVTTIRRLRDQIFV